MNAGQELRVVRFRLFETDSTCTIDQCNLRLCSQCVTGGHFISLLWSQRQQAIEGVCQTVQHVSVYVLINQYMVMNDRRYSVSEYQWTQSIVLYSHVPVDDHLYPSSVLRFSVNMGIIVNGYGTCASNRIGNFRILM